MGRPVLALLVAGLTVYILVTAYLSRGAFPVGNNVVVAFFNAIISFTGVLLLGLPAYLFLLARKWTALWIAPVAGFIVAAVVWYVFISLLGLSSVNSLSDFLSGLTDLPTFKMALWPVGPIGAVAGVVVWLIARPDRSAAAGNSRNTDKYPKY
jgi:hypothetical protein